jgi:hypothetical protein
VGQTDSRVRAQYAFDDTISSSAEGPYLCLAHIRQVTRPSFGHYCSPYKGPSLNADDDSGSRLSITCTTGVLRGRCDPMPLGQSRMCTQWFTWPPMAVLHVSVSAQQKALYCWQLPLNAPYAFVPKNLGHSTSCFKEPPAIGLIDTSFVSNSRSNVRAQEPPDSPS